MPVLPEAMVLLSGALAKLPGIGPRSAERIALHLVHADEKWVQELAQIIVTARQRVSLCTNCGALTEQPVCDTCTDPRRDPSTVCVVERPVDILSIEKSGTFKGRYHVLGGKISPLNGVEPEDLAIASLERRLAAEPIKEIIVALGSDVEGDATSYYLGKRLSREGVKVTRIAHGLPAGTGLEFADEVTLSRALEGRREL